MTYGYYDREPSLSGPPRLLVWAVVIFFLLVVVVGIGLIIYLSNGRRLGALIPYAAAVGALIPVVVIGGGVIFRKRLPRFFLLWAVLFFVLVAAVGAFASIFVYRSVLPPRYQEEMLTVVPFMRVFLPPTPAGGIIPTVGAESTSSLSPEDLLSMPLFGATATPVSGAEATEQTTPTDAPTPTPTETQPPTTVPTETPTVPPTDISPTAAPTQAAIAPTTNPLLVSSQSSASSLPVTARMFGFRHEQQTWNNCGPANVTMALSYYGWRDNQDVAARFLKPETEDKNVSPHEMVAFVNEQTGVRALYRVGGDMALLKAFIANNFPIIIETAYAPEGYDWIGHYRTVVGYDDLQRVFFIYDSFLGTGENGDGITESYDQFDANWQAFNRVFIVLYRQEEENTVRAILGEREDPQRAAEIALATAQSEARANPQNPFAWFNMGSSYALLQRYTEAAAAYDRAVSLGLPFRMNWYQFGMFESYFNVGRLSDVLVLVQTNLTNGAQYVEETYYWQGRVFAEQGRAQEAAAAFRRALQQNPRYAAAQDALDALNI